MDTSFQKTPSATWLLILQKPPENRGLFTIGALDWIRTSGPQSRSLILYPTELQAHIYENRETRGSQLCKNSGQTVVNGENFSFLKPRQP